MMWWRAVGPSLLLQCWRCRGPVDKDDDLGLCEDCIHELQEEE